MTVGPSPKGGGRSRLAPPLNPPLEWINNGEGWIGLGLPTHFITMSDFMECCRSFLMRFSCLLYN